MSGKVFALVEPHLEFVDNFKHAFLDQVPLFIHKLDAEKALNEKLLSDIRTSIPFADQYYSIGYIIKDTSIETFCIKANKILEPTGLFFNIKFSLLEQLDDIISKLDDSTLLQLVSLLNIPYPTIVEKELL